MGTGWQPERETDLPDRGRLPIVGRERSLAIDGHGWTVREVIDPTTQGKALIFSSDRVARRVRNYPANWRDLDDPDLYALSWHT
jgi:hypothetical protein